MNSDDLFSADWRQYLREIGQHPLLEAAEELELACAMDAGRDAARRVRSAQDTLSAGRRAELEERIDAGRRARERLVESNLRLVVSIAGRYAGRGLSLQDLIQEGNTGLQLGIDKYNWRKGFRLSTYVYWWIRQAMTRALEQRRRAQVAQQEVSMRRGEARDAGHRLLAAYRQNDIRQLRRGTFNPIRRMSMANQGRQGQVPKRFGPTAIGLLDFYSAWHSWRRLIEQQLR